MWLTFCNMNHMKMSRQLLLKNKKNKKNPQVMDRVQATCFFFSKEKTIYEQ